MKARLADLALRMAILSRLLGVILASRITTVCIGELLASGWIIACLRRIPGLRVVVYVHGEELTTDDPWDPGHRRARAAMLDADSIVVVSRFTAEAAAALLGPEAALRIATIPNGVDLERFQPGPRRTDLQDRYGLRHGFTFVTVCRLLEKKGVDQTIRALAELPTDCRLLVVGTGPFEPQLRALAESCGVADAVRFAGAVAPAELADHYRLGDVFVMPNRAMPNGDTEGFGLVFLEANACGLPVIAGQDGGSPEAVQDGVNGLVVDGHSVAAVAAAMRRLREDAVLRDRLRTGGAKVAAAADWRLKARTFLDLCRKPERHRH
ncbi:glycosyltransferase family 4 protein [Neoroseomonas alba]|uniref:glycosyltransferase family 4 protein n=1 Tax=Roseomonas alba TaxID=2846776 RepID=UPI0034E1A27B